MDQAGCEPIRRGWICCPPMPRRTKACAGWARPVFSNRGGVFHKVLALQNGGERRPISAGVSRSSTIIGHHTGDKTTEKWKAAWSSSLSPVLAPVSLQLAIPWTTPETENKVAIGPLVAGGRESRSGGCARSLEAGGGAGSDAKTPRPQGSSGAAGCRERSLSSGR